MRRPRRRRRWPWIVAAAILLPSVAVGGFALRYPGLSSGVVHQLRYASLEESRNLWLCLRYLTESLEQLVFDSERGVYDFENRLVDDLDAFERGRLAFHRGNYLEAELLMARFDARHGESERGLLWRALAGLREAESINCLDSLAEAGGDHDAHDRARYCSLPLLEIHRRKADGLGAARALERLLERDLHPADERLYKWLLTFSYMTVGGFPGEVPERHRIDSRFIDLFYGEEAVRRRRAHAGLELVERGRELGVDAFGAGRGAAVEDFDGDGDLDLVTADGYGGLTLFLNQEGERFADAREGSGLEAVRQPTSLTVADYDGDGDQDLFAACPFSHFRLLENRGDARFDDVTGASGLLDSLPPETVAASWMSAWGDVDNDGDLDLFVAGWALELPFLDGVAGSRRLDSKLFVNEDGRFRDASSDFGLAERFHDRHQVGVAFGDYDGDGWLDLYVTGPIPGTSVLLRNREGRRFEPDPAYASTDPGFTAAFVDVDHDGRLDLFRGGVADARTAVSLGVFGEGRETLLGGRNAIYLQGDDGRFEPRPDLFDGADLPIGSMGASFGDLDNDGCLDFYLGTGGPEPWFVLPNLMYRGVAGPDGGCSGRMENVSMLAGFGTVQKGHGIVFFDFDGDGDQDLFSSLGGMWPADRWYSQMFVNGTESGNAWVKIRLRGRRSNRFGVGSRIEVVARRDDGTGVTRTYLMDGKTGFGSAPQLAHVGLGPAVAIERVTVRWQGSGCVGSYPARINALEVLDEADCLGERAG